MAKYLKPILSLVLLVAINGTATANIIAVVTQSTADGRLEDSAGIDTGTGTIPVDISNEQISQFFGSRDVGSASSYESISDVDGDVIFFQNGNASFGLQTVSTSITIVDIEFTNTGTEAIQPVLNSQITPAGMGFFLTDCDAIILTECESSDNPAFNLENISGFGGNAGDPILGSSFNFRVVAKDSANGGAGPLEEGEVLFSKQGSLQLNSGGSGNPNVIVEDLSEVSGFLTNFRQTSPFGSTQELTFDWGATDFLVEFPDFILPGESSVVSYITEVQTYSFSNCIENGTDCGVAYAAFGDPIGRGGAGKTRPQSLARSILASTVSPTPAANGINGITAGVYTMNFPIVNGNQITYKAISGPGITQPTAVPVPAPVGLLMLGLAALVINRRRQSK